ncbi:MAG: PhoH family protein [Gammaproteobacteria bacterium]|nr:PhoH family protein [Gammaproteobacteria bacterium]
MTALTKLFVLDTNVLMHDPAALFRFEEHDVYVPVVVLEELDMHKKGVSELARNARQASRFIDETLSGAGDLTIGAPLPGTAQRPGGRLFIPIDEESPPAGFTTATTDNRLLALTQTLTRTHRGREVVLVSQDINLRIKARTLGLKTEDYTSERVLEDADLLYRGVDSLSGTAAIETPAEQGMPYLIRPGGPAAWFPNGFLVGSALPAPLQALRIRECTDDYVTADPVQDYTRLRVWGINARNLEQNLALNLLMDPDVDFVSLLGQAGTGKTLLTLAAALEQTIEQKRYSEIIVTRVTIPVGADIGFLPGTEEEKMSPWMGAFEDNLDVLNRTELGTPAHSQWARAAAHDLVRSRLKIKSLNFMRGRTFQQKFLIIDEAQNLSAHQIKTLVTRAGPGTKVVCLGNIAQIDTPYLTETTSGMTYVVDRFKAWMHSGHITLQRGERSRLADYAAATL